MAWSIAICIASFLVLLVMLRSDGASLGLPIAYLFSLLLIHVPGAYVHLVTTFLNYTNFVETGIALTAVGAVSFVAGVAAVWLLPIPRRPPARPATPDEHTFTIFCLAGGWLFTYAMSSLNSIPSLGAAVDRAGSIWMLGVLLGLRAAVSRGDLKWAALWLSALAVYPALMLLLGGFLSYGSAAVIVVMAVLAVSVQSRLKLAVGLVAGVYLGLNVFVNYFTHRKEIRQEVWGGAPLEERIDVTLDVVREFSWFDPDNRAQAAAFDARLNQNYFAGLAAARIEQGSVDYLYGRSVWEGMIALVPRAMWPEKPVFAGSPKIVAEMTGLRLNENTSFGVGNVMEFQINFGTPGVIGGFFILGLLIRLCDRTAAVAVRRCDFGTAVVAFLPAVALIQPNGSMIELCSGGAAALLAGFAWRWAWTRWSARLMRKARGLRRV